MNFDLDETVEKIKKNENFLKLKKVIENNVGHDHEPVYDHCIKTFELAKKNIDGHLITNEAAKKEFEKYINAEVGGIKKRDLMLLTALIHDYGKLAVFDDGGKKININVKFPDGHTMAQGHDYWGSVMIRDFLSEFDLPSESTDYISRIINLHLAGWSYWEDHALSVKERLWKFKLRLQNVHIEVFFNIYCDAFYGNNFKKSLNYPIELLNMPEAYSTLKISYID